MTRQLRRPGRAPTAREHRAMVRYHLNQQRAAAIVVHAAMVSEYEKAMGDSALALEALDLADRIEQAGAGQ